MLFMVPAQDLAWRSSYAAAAAAAVASRQIMWFDKVYRTLFFANICKWTDNHFCLIIGDGEKV
jgi:hypothetical protein